MPRRSPAPLLIGAGLLSIGFLIASGYLGASSPTAETVATARATSSAPSGRPGLALTPAATPSGAAVRPAPLPAHVLDIRPTATMSWAPVLAPGNFVDVYQLIDPAHGFLASGGTEYLVAHSYAKGSGAPGNTWEALHIGDAVSSGDRTIIVQRIATPAKGDLASEPVWTNDPNRLVLITCVSRGLGSPATNNMVITTETVP